MIFVLIIGILIAIAIPVYNNIQANAERRACEANQRTIMSQMQVYSAETQTVKDTLGWGAAIDTADELTAFLSETRYFVETPTCPSGGAYGFASGSTTVVACDVHN